MIKPNLQVRIAGIRWKNPITVASGTYGVDWPMSKNLDEKKLGALTVKTITLEPREGHKPPTMTKTEAGMLNAVGLKNPGLDKFTQEELPQCAKFGVPIIVSIAGKTEEEYVELAKALDKQKTINYIEVNVSCPNVKTGMAFGTDPYLLENLTRSICQVTTKPVIVKLSPNVTDIVSCALAAERGGASAISLINTLLGMVVNLETGKPILSNNMGGLSGPTVKPVALRMVWQVAQAVKIPIIGMGGVASAKDALEFIMAGATAVSVGTANYNNPKVTSEIIKGVEEYLINKNISDINELRGTLELNGNMPISKGCKMNFINWLKDKQKENESLVCVGLDTSIDKLPQGLSKDNEGVWQFNKAIIDSTYDQVCAYKPNMAFYEADNTLEALKRTVEYAHKKGVPVIADAKRGDVGNTAEAYARAIFDNFGFDGVTVNAYMGYDCVQPFSAYKDKGVIVVTRSSNPGAKDLQDIKDQQGRPIYMNMLQKVLEWNTNDNLLMVAGATYPEEMAQMRQAAPDITFLVPGIGKQGGDLASTVKNGIDENGLGMIINNARGIIYASSGADFAEAARAETIKMKNEINKHRKAKLILDMFEAEAVKFGNFTLKSGLKSPIYIDLRPLVSYPILMQKIAKELTKLIQSIKYDVLAGVPYTALPIAVHLSSQLNKPMIYARKETKDYGTARKIEGVFKEGDKCLIIDDMITDGASKFENITPIEKAGIKVKDVVVVLDREQGGDKKLKAKGYKLTSLFKLTEVLEILRDYGMITDEKYQEVIDYLKKTQVK